VGTSSWIEKEKAKQDLFLTAQHRK